MGGNGEKDDMAVDECPDMNVCTAMRRGVVDESAPT